MRVRRAILSALATLCLCSVVLSPNTVAHPEKSPVWVAAWISAPSPFLPGGGGAHLEPYADVTVRQVLRVNTGGTELRVRFSNELGREELRIGAASLGRASGDGAMTSDIVPLKFSGKGGVVIPPGAMMLSDPIRMAVARFDDLAISTFFPDPTRPNGHRHQVEVSGEGNHALDPGWAGHKRVRGATAVSGVQVRSESIRRVLVAFGDSITEGAGATPGAHMSWPSQLSRQLAQREWAQDWIVVNAGISGNRMLHDGGSQNGLARFDRDALSVAGVTDIILLEGVNDLGVAYSPKYGGKDVVNADDLIHSYRQMIERAHIRGVRIYGATILPYGGAAYFSPAGEVERLKVNAWIRDSGAFDGVIDLDAVMSQPKDQSRLIEEYEIGDRLHPGDSGYAAMAEAVEAFLAEQAGAD